MERQLKESATLPDFWVADYGDFGNSQVDSWLPYMAGNVGRRHGANYPFFLNLQQHGFLRDFSRLIVGQNMFAQGMLEALTSFIVGEGITWTVQQKANTEIIPELAAQAQAVLDGFLAASSWWQVEREAFARSRRDGEFFLRWFVDDVGSGEVRFVEPEQVIEPPNPTNEWSLGCLNEEGDVAKILAYWVCYEHDSSQGEEVPAEEMLHYKANVDSTIKRGMPDFSFGTREILDSAYKLLRNMSEGSAIQAAIAEIWQHETATQAQVQGFIDDQAAFVRTNPYTAKTESIQKIAPGTRRDIPKGMTSIPPPYTAGVPGHVSVFESCLRSAAARWNAPEWIISSNAANMGAYTSSLVAESPFVMRGKAEQKAYIQTFRTMLWQVLQAAVGAGRLDERALTHLELQGKAPRIEIRNKLEQAQVDQVYVGLGVKSRQTVQLELGLDSEQELANQEEYNERFGAQGGGLPMPGMPGEGGEAPPSPFRESLELDEGGVGSNQAFSWNQADLVFETAEECACEDGLIRLPDLSQGADYTCGASAMQAICEYFGVGPETEAEYVQALGSDQQDGTNVDRILEFGRQQGLEVAAKEEMTSKEIAALVDAGRPVLVLIQAWAEQPSDYADYANGHYVVVIGHDDKGFIFEDPSLKGTRGSLPYGEFERRWHDEDGRKKYVRWGAAFWRAEKTQPIEGK